MLNDLIQRAITNSLNDKASRLTIPKCRASNQFRDSYSHSYHYLDNTVRLVYQIGDQEEKEEEANKSHDGQCNCQVKLKEVCEPLAGHLSEQQASGQIKNIIIISQLQASEAPPRAKEISDKNGNDDSSNITQASKRLIDCNSNINKDSSDINSHGCDNGSAARSLRAIDYYYASESAIEPRGSTATLCDFRRFELKAAASHGRRLPHKRKARSEGRSSDTGSQLEARNRSKQPSWATSMFASSISNNKLHCGLFVLILFLVIFLLVPLKLISNANYKINKSIRVEKPSLKSDLSDFNCTKFAREANFTFAQPDGQCSEGSFACATTCKNVCIPQAKNCNEVHDCPDGSDEDTLDCFDFYGVSEPMFFRIVRSYKMPDVNWSTPASCTKEKMINNQCPCNITDPLVIICDKRDFYRIPDKMLPTVYKVRMSSNSILTLNFVTWPVALKKLVLEDNKLTSLDNDTFLSAPNLEGLFLNNNNISVIQPDAFRGAHQLTRLEVRQNSISGLDLSVFRHTPKLTFLDLSYNQIEFVNDLEFRLLPNLMDLNLGENSIVSIGSETFAYMPACQSLSLEGNQIEAIAEFAFYNSSHITEINLSRNKLANLTRSMFTSLSRLKKLDLSQNGRLQTLQDDTFRELDGLKSLDLSGVPLRNLQKSWFSYLQLKFIYFSQFDHCFYASKARVCSPHSDGISTGSQLVLSEFKYYVWALAFVCCLGNLFVFAWRSPQEDQSLSLIVRNLSIADLMMGLYLVVVSWKNERFGNAYGSQAIDWINSPHCTLMGFLAILSSQLSLSIIFIITIERYRSITSLVNLESAELRQRARNLLVCAWLSASSIAMIPLAGWLFEDKIHIYGNNGLCLPLYIDRPFNKGWQYSAIVYLGINFAAVMIILGLYVRMYLIIMSVRKKTRPVRTLLTSERQREDVTLALRFLFIVVADCLCWIPIVVIKFCALIGLKVTHDIYCWLVVFILPINSALNPIIYTIGTPSYLRTVIFNKILAILSVICNALDALYKNGFTSLPFPSSRKMASSSRAKKRSSCARTSTNLDWRPSKGTRAGFFSRYQRQRQQRRQRQSCSSATSTSSSLPSCSLAYQNCYARQHRNSIASSTIAEEKLTEKLDNVGTAVVATSTANYDQLAFIDGDSEEIESSTRFRCELELRPDRFDNSTHRSASGSHFLSNFEFARDYLRRIDQTLSRTRHEIVVRNGQLANGIASEGESNQFQLVKSGRIGLDWEQAAITRSWVVRAPSLSSGSGSNSNWAPLCKRGARGREDAANESEVDIVELAARHILGVRPKSANCDTDDWRSWLPLQAAAKPDSC